MIHYLQFGAGHKPVGIKMPPICIGGIYLYSVGIKRALTAAASISTSAH